MLRIVGPDFTPELYDTFVDTNTGRTVLVMEVADSHAELDTFCTRHGARKKLDELATRHHAQVSRTPVDVHVHVHVHVACACMCMYMCPPQAWGPAAHSPAPSPPPPDPSTTRSGCCSACWRCTRRASRTST